MKDNKGVPLPKTKRNEQLLLDRISGLTFAELGKRYKISRARAQQICRKVVGLNK